MLITRKSIITGAINTINVPNLTDAMVENWENGMMIQDAMPNIPLDLREFVMTGITPDEWSNHLGEESEDEEDDRERRVVDGMADVQCEEHYNEDSGYIPSAEEYFEEPEEDEDSWRADYPMPYLDEQE